MVFTLLKRLSALGAAVVALACGDGGTTPPGPPSQIAKSGGDQQSWYFNNPLPVPYGVTVRDANGRGVRGVLVDWGITTGIPSTLSPDPSTTNSDGVATTVHTLGSATTYVVTATVEGLPSVTFSASASAPPTSAAVSLSSLRFNPSSVVVQMNTGAQGVGEVTWTWNDGGIVHNLTFGSGPAPQANEPDRSSGSVSRTFTVVGTYNYTCTRHPGMSGTVTVVN